LQVSLLFNPWPIGVAVDIIVVFGGPQDQRQRQRTQVRRAVRR
jgi:hypothetical protein